MSKSDARRRSEGWRDDRRHAALATTVMARGGEGAHGRKDEQREGLAKALAVELAVELALTVELVLTVVVALTVAVEGMARETARWERWWC